MVEATEGFSGCQRWERCGGGAMQAPAGAKRSMVDRCRRGRVQTARRRDRGPVGVKTGNMKPKMSPYLCNVQNSLRETTTALKAEQCACPQAMLRALQHSLFGEDKMKRAEGSQVHSKQKAAESHGLVKGGRSSPKKSCVRLLLEVGKAREAVVMSAPLLALNLLLHLASEFESQAPIPRATQHHSVTKLCISRLGRFNQEK